MEKHRLLLAQDEARDVFGASSSGAWLLIGMGT